MILLSGPSSGSAYCVAWVGTDVTSGLWEEAHVSPWSRRRCGPGHCSHIIAHTLCLHKCSGTQGQRGTHVPPTRGLHSACLSGAANLSEV